MSNLKYIVELVAILPFVLHIRSGRYKIGSRELDLDNEVFRAVGLSSGFETGRKLAIFCWRETSDEYLRTFPHLAKADYIYRQKLPTVIRTFAYVEAEKLETKDSWDLSNPTLTIFFDTVNQLIDAYQFSFDFTPITWRVGHVSIFNLWQINIRVWDETNSKELLSVAMHILDDEIERHSKIVGEGEVDQSVRKELVYDRLSQLAESNVWSPSISWLGRACSNIGRAEFAQAIVSAFSGLEARTQEILGMLKISRKPDSAVRLGDARGPLEEMLGRALKEISGHSVIEEKPELWKEVKSWRRVRNEIVHFGRGATFHEAEQAIKSCLAVTDYLADITKANELHERFRLVFRNDGMYVEHS